MPFLSANAAKSIEPTPGYLTPGKIEPGKSVRFALLQKEPLEFYEVWATSPDGKASKAFRFDFEPTTEDVLAECGDFAPREYDNRPGCPQVKFSIAVPIYNYATSGVQVLQLTQVTIIRELDGVSQMEDYSDLLAVDFTLSRKGSGKESEYKLLPVPRKKGSDEAIQEAWQAAQAAGFDLGRMLTGGNPFKPGA